MSELLIEVPLIWTSKGNIPVKDLEYNTEWTNNDDFIMLTESYKLDSEVVKSSSHVYSKKGLDMSAVNNKL